MEKAVSAKSFLLNYFRILAFSSMVLLTISIITHHLVPNYSLAFVNRINWETLLVYMTVGFLAQLIDGSLGMAYGVSSTSFLMSTGVSPVLASASVHIAEIFTTASSGFFHWRFGNIDKSLFKKLLIPGAIGAGIGAYLLSNIDGKTIKPYIAGYLALMGIVIIVKAFKKVVLKEPKKVQALALFGGLIDASGGGGWGPVVTTTLVSNGNCPRKTIGTVNAVEFFVSLTAGGIFTIFVGFQSIEIVTGLILGGLLASPLGAMIVSRINKKLCMVLIGILIVFLSLRTIIQSIC
ncbi:MAG TPA: ABC transporter permease [Lentisphaeria bacterium]|nr:MAG: hypothetical protein A2X47_11060 [Lentisphaerae bacterium GWF2_38_69]HBM17302.1 ABC transporter permease [Lentisphaeria bacterium]